jgi:N-acetylneuraminic acid mutarotase
MKPTILLTAILILCTVTLSYGQWSYSSLSEPKSMMGSCSLDNKAYFAGGYNGTDVLSTVECYDAETNTWDSPGELSIARQCPVTVTCGSKIFFAGGMKYEGLVVYSTVDIYDTENGEWEVENLSTARFDVAAVSYGSKVLFAGGFTFPFNTFPVVNIYDVETNEWSYAMLSQSRGGMACAVVGDLAIFAGGFANSSTAVSDRVDIYNFTDGTWSTVSLSQARAYASATTVGDKVVIAGGVTSMNHPTDAVDIYDASDNSWETSTLSQARAWLGKGATVNGKAWFAGGGNFNYGFYNPADVIDIYDGASDTWSEDVLFEPHMDHSVVGIGNYVVIAGGMNSEETFTSLVEIYYDPPTGTGSEPDEEVFFTIYPNPVNEFLTISTRNNKEADKIIIYDQAGQAVLKKIPASNTLDVSPLLPGIYIIEIIYNQQRSRQKLVIE